LEEARAGETLLSRTASPNLQINACRLRVLR
jgi:hypothetical protein